MLLLRLLALAALWAAAPAAQAFDCPRAATAVEKAICSAPGLIRADDAMVGAYEKLKRQLDASERDALRISQLRWIKRREGCSDAEGGDVKSCIADSTARRHALLTAEPETGPGDGSDLVPWFIQKEGKPGGWDIDLNLVRFAEPQSAGEALFNREAAALALPALLENSTLGTASLKVEKDRIYAKAVSLSPIYASRRLISALAEGYDDTGGAHGLEWQRVINVDLDEGRLLTFGDLFPRDATGILAKLCADQLITVRRVRTEDPAINLEEGADEIILSHVRDLERWALRSDRAVVLFDPYEIGSYAEGSYACTLDMAKLRSMAYPTAPLPR